MTELGRLPAAEARKVLTLAAIAVRAKAERRSVMIPLRLDGGEITPQAIRAGVRDLLSARRSERGQEHVDLRGLAEYG